MIKGAGGSSLIEVIIAAALFTVMMTVVAQLSLAVQQANAFTNERAAAMAAAAERLAELKSLEVMDLLLEDGAEFPVERRIDDSIIALAPDSTDGRLEPGKLSIEPIGNGHYLRIVIDIRWTSATGQGRYTLSAGRESSE